MRLRWITILAALVLKVALVAAKFLLGRLVLQRDYAKLEREHVQGDVAQVVLLLQSQLDDFDVIAHDFAWWDATYEFMKHPSRRYVNFRSVEQRHAH